MMGAIMCDQDQDYMFFSSAVHIVILIVVSFILILQIATSAESCDRLDRIEQKCGANHAGTIDEGTN